MARSRAIWLDGQNSWEKASCPTATPAVVPEGRSQPAHYSWIDPDLMQVLSRPAGVNPVLNANDLSFDFEVGPRISAIRHFDTCCDIEIAYFQIGGWSAVALPVAIQP